MKKRCLRFMSMLMLIIFTVAQTSGLFSQAAMDPNQPITQGEFAVYLVRALALERNLPLAPSERDYVVALEEQGIYPPGGFEPNKPLTKKDMAFLMMKVTGIENQVINRMTGGGKGIVKKEKATIVKMTGTVEFQRGKRGSYAKAELNDDLYLNDSLRTGKDSSAELRIGKFGAAHIGENTEITMEELGSSAEGKEKVRVYIKQGEIIVKVDNKGVKGAVEFETRSETTVAGVMGTTYLHFASPKVERVECSESEIKVYFLDSEGKPVGEPFVLKPQDIISPPAQEGGTPDITTMSQQQQERINKIALELAKYLLETGEISAQAGAGPEGISTYQARQELAEGTELALNAVLDELAEQGVIIESGGAASVSEGAATAVTHAQITDFFETGMINQLFSYYNVDVTPIGAGPGGTTGVGAPPPPPPPPSGGGGGSL